MGRSGLILATIGMLVIGGCANADQVTADDLLGLWRAAGTIFFELNEDGAFRVALAESVENAVVDRGLFTTDEGRLTFTSDEGSVTCSAGQQGTYEIDRLELGPAGEARFGLSQVDEECDARGSHGDYTLVRVAS